MVNPGYDFREPPKDAVGLSAYAPPEPAKALAVESPLAEPEAMVAKASKPRKRAWQSKPGARGIRIQERPLSMQRWDVSPHNIAEQLGSE
jgi:hypothetical protein